MSVRPRDGNAGRARGAKGWVDVRGRRLGTWAFALNRVTGLLLVAYLYLHLAVLSLLARGAGSWGSFLRLARSRFFLGLDVLLILAILIHSLNGLRVALVGSGFAIGRHKGLFWTVVVLGALVLAYAAIRILGEG